MAANLEVDLDLDVDKTANKAKKKLTSTGKKSGKAFSSGFSSGLKGIAAAFIGIAAITKGLAFFKESINLASIQEDSINELNTALKNTGQFTEQASRDFQGYASALQSVTTLGDEAILSTGALIQSLGALPVDKLKEATTAAADLSAGLGIDLRSAATLVGKAAAGEVSSFSRYGLAIQKGANNADTFKNALDALSERFGGAAQARVKTFSGATQQLSNQFGDFQEAIGEIITGSPALISFFNTTTELFAKLTGATQEAAKGDPLKPLLLGLIAIARTINDFVIPPFRTLFSFISKGVSVAELAIQGLITGLVSAFSELIDVAAMIPGAIGAPFRAIADEVRAAKEATDEVLGEVVDDTLANLLSESDSEVFREQIDGVLSAYQAGIDKAREFKKEVVKAAKETADDVEKSTKNMAKSLNNNLGNAVAGAIETFSESLLKGGLTVSSFVQNAIIMLADFAIQAGKIFVATGIAQKGLFTAGAGILAGAALIAAGTIAKSIFGGGGADASTSGGSGGGPLATQPEFSAPDPEEREEAQTRVNITVQGDIMDSEETGLRIATILENASLNENVRVLGGLA